MCLKVITPYWLRGTSLALKCFLVLECKRYWLWTHSQIMQSFCPSLDCQMFEPHFSSVLLRGHTARDPQTAVKSDSLSEGIQICFLLSSQDGWVTPQAVVDHFYGRKGCVISVASAQSIFLDDSRLRKGQVWLYVFVKPLTCEPSPLLSTFWAFPASLRWWTWYLLIFEIQEST